MKNIILTGTYNSKNKGDAAMELSTAMALKSALPDAVVNIHTPFPEMDKPFYDPIPVMRCSRRRLIWGSFLVLLGLLWRLTGWKFLIQWNPELTSYADADIVVDLSGDMQTESYGPHVAYSHFIPIALALALKRPVMLCAQSIGPFKWTMPMARFLFNRVDLITVRDEISDEYLKKMKLNTPVHLTADMAFLLKPASDDRVDEILKHESIDISGKKVFGVSVSGLIASHFQKKNLLAKKISFEQFMARELDLFIDQTDMDCVFVPHVTGPAVIKDDRVAAQKVVKYMKHSQKVQIIKGDYRPDELKGVIKRFWIHTGARMHASIGAVTTGVPVASISYSHKTPGVMAQFGLGDYVIDISSWKTGALAINLKTLHENRKRISHSLFHTHKKLQKQSLANINQILTLI